MRVSRAVGPVPTAEPADGLHEHQHTNVLTRASCALEPLTIGDGETCVQPRRFVYRLAEFGQRAHLKLLHGDHTEGLHVVHLVIETLTIASIV